MIQKSQQIGKNCMFNCVCWANFLALPSDLNIFVAVLFTPQKHFILDPFYMRMGLLL